MSPFIIAVAGSLLAGPASATPKTVFRPPITVAGEVSTAELEALGGRVDDEFARTEFESVLPLEPSACTTAPCWQSQAEATGSRYIVSISVDALDADQRLAMSIVDLADGSTVTQLERTCELCGRDELLDAIADLSATGLRKMQSHAAITTEVSVDSVPAGAVVMLDGEEVGTTPVRIEVSPGPHTVELSAAGYAPFSQALDVGRGTTQSVHLRLSESVQPAPPPEVPAPAPAPAPTRRRGRVLAGAALVGGGLAAAAAGVTMMVLHARPITSDCSGTEVDSDGNCHFLHNTRTGGIIGLSAGATALVGGAVLLGLELRRDRPGTVALSPTPSGLLLRGRF